MAKEEKVKTYMVKLKLVVENGIGTVYDSENMKVDPKPIMFRGGNCYADYDAPMKAIGYQIHSVQEEFGSSDDSPELIMTYEIEPLKDTEHWNTATAIRYLTTIVHPTIAYYLAETVEAAKQANDTVEAAIEKNPELFELSDER
jgi:hypothetical protein